MSIKYYECAFTDTDDYMLVPKDKMGEVVKAMEVMCSQGFPPNLAKERILEIFFTKGQKEPGTSTTSDICNKDEPSEAMGDKRPLSTADKKIVEESKRSENLTRIPPNAGECKVTINPPNRSTTIVEEPKQHTKNRKCSSAGECTYNKSPSVINLVEKPMECANDDSRTGRSSFTGECKVRKYEDTTNKLKLDEIFPNSDEESNIDLISQLSSLRVAPEKRTKAAVEENKSLASPVPAKNAKVEIPEPSSGKPTASKAKTSASHTAKSEVKEFSIPVPPPFPPTSVKDRRDKSPTNKLLPPVNEAKQVVTQKNNKNPLNPALMNKEETLIRVNAKAKGSASTLSSKNDENALPQDKKIENKEKPTTTPMSTSAVCVEAPPKETMMAGGECFAAVDGIGQETGSSPIATTSRRTSKVSQQRSRETDKTKKTISKNISKPNNNKSWKKKHLVIAGGIGIAMICFYAFFKNKT